MDYLVADLHLDHANVIKHCQRPFEDVDTMNDFLIYALCEVLTAKDDLWVVGDFTFHSKRAKEFLDRIPGRKHLIDGNHDDKKVRALTEWSSVQKIKHLKVGGETYVLCHYPFESWRRNSYHAHGHLHGNLSTTKPGRLDVGVDHLARLREDLGAKRTDLSTWAPCSLEEFRRLAGPYPVYNRDSGTMGSTRATG